ncbi:MAG: AI-2E family transporter, partial [Calditrichaeota bacterium]|nr:AI-2E family transporter [Calditrichota bacterium]
MMEATLRRWVKTMLIVLMVIGVLVFLVAIGDLVKLVIISALLAYILDPLVTLIESNGINRTPA